MKRFLRSLVTAGALTCVALTASAADFDGSRPLICAPVEAMDCTTGLDCIKGQPLDIGAPQFMRIDFEKRVVVGTERTTPFLHFEDTNGQLLLQGTELGFGWTLVIDQTTGNLFGSLANRNGIFVLAGACTPN